MGKQIAVGERMPFFQYDTPYSQRNSFRQLAARQAPLTVVFFSNFGHPVTRHFVRAYAKTFAALQSGGLALVVRSRPDRLAGTVGPDSLPYTLLCDAEGALYAHLDIPQKPAGPLTVSLEAWKILQEARKKGYQAPAGAPQQLPLTLILGADGTVLFCHYGTTFTDVPEDCAAIEALLADLSLARPAAPAPVPACAAGAAPGGLDAAGEASGWTDPAAEPPETVDELLGRASEAPAAQPRRILRAVRPARAAGAGAEAEEEEDTAEFPVSGKRPLGPAKGYPQPGGLYPDAPLEKTMELGYFNDPYGDE